jgi:hypothetical protein
MLTTPVAEEHIPPYQEQFPRGTWVAVACADELAEFRRTWRLHNPLSSRQLEYAGRVAQVLSVGPYHGGDMLYELRGVRGTWHECCLRAASEDEISVAQQSGGFFKRVLRRVGLA